MRVWEFLLFAAPTSGGYQIRVCITWWPTLTSCTDRPCWPIMIMTSPQACTTPHGPYARCRRWLHGSISGKSYGGTARAAPGKSSWSTGLCTESYGKARSGDGDRDAKPAPEGNARTSTKRAYNRHQLYANWKITTDRVRRHRTRTKTNYHYGRVNCTSTTSHDLQD